MSVRGASRRGRMLVWLSLMTAIVCTSSTSAHAAAPPGGRAYERVSPQDTNGAFALQPNLGNPTEAIVDDDDVLFGTGVVPGANDSPSGSEDLYLAQRTASGWTDTSFGPPTSSPYADDNNLVGATRDLSAAVFSAVPSITLGAAPNQGASGELIYRNATGQFTPIVTDADPTDSGDPSSFDISLFGGMSADGQTVVYSSDVSPAGLPSTGGLREVYVWQPDGQVTRVPNGGGEAADCGNEVAGFVDQTIVSGVIGNATNAVSSDGSTVFLSSGDPSGTTDCPPPQLYVSSGGTTTLISTPTQAGVPAPSPLAGVTFVGASPDGQAAYFTTTEQLTSDAPSGQDELYEWQAASGGTPASVTCVSCAVAPDGIGNDTVVAPSGGYVYFEGPQETDQTTDAVTVDLYVVHDGATQLASVVDGTGVELLSTNDTGDDAVFTNVQFDQTTTDYTYELERVSDGPSGPAATCLSCTPDGTPESADMLNFAAGFVEQTAQAPPSEAGLLGLGGSMSADGTQVVFHSTAALTPDATEGVDQVYLWTAGEGLSLIAPAATDAEISPDGTNIIFQSTDALTPDTTQADTGTLYDARVSGGFAASTPTAPSCTGSACRGLSPAPPTPPTVASTGRTSGAAHSTSGHLPLSVRRMPRLTARALRQLSDGGTLRLRVAVRGAGRLRATLSAHVGGRERTLARATARVHGRRPTVVLALRLTRSAQARVRAAGSVRATLTLSLPGGVTRRIRFIVPARRSS